MAQWADRRPVLVVDDDDALRDLVATILSEEGYAVRTAASAAEALSAAQRERPGVVLMDVNMPGLDGLSACRLMRDDDRLKPLPVVIMSAQPVGGDQLRHARANYFLSKPFNIADLVNEVERCVGQHAAA